jgi:hypothetical protein
MRVTIALYGEPEGLFGCDRRLGFRERARLETGRWATEGSKVLQRVPAQQISMRSLRFSNFLTMRFIRQDRRGDDPIACAGVLRWIEEKEQQ